MNHVYKLVFNQSLHVWQAVSELTRSRRKGGRSARVQGVVRAASLSGAAMALLLSPLLMQQGAVQAQEAVCTDTDADSVTDECAVALNWNTSNYKTNAYTLDDGTTKTLTGNFAVAPSQTVVGVITYDQYFARGGTVTVGTGPAGATTPIDYADLPLAFPVESVGFPNSATNAIVVPDPVNPQTGTITYNAFQSANFTASSNAGSRGGLNVISRSADEANIYDQFRIADVSNGTLIVDVNAPILGNRTGVNSTNLGTTGGTGNIGPGVPLYTAGVNNTVASKNGTILFKATDTGNIRIAQDTWASFGSVSIPANMLAPITVAWQSTTVNWRSESADGVTPGGLATPVAWASPLNDGTTHLITDQASLQAWNDYLIAAMKKQPDEPGYLSTTDYRNLVTYPLINDGDSASPYTTGGQRYELTYDPTMGQSVDPNNLIFAPTGTLALAQADGPNATVSIDPGIYVLQQGGNAILLATNGGTAINNGLLSNGSSDNVKHMLVQSGSHGINNGAIMVNNSITATTRGTAENNLSNPGGSGGGNNPRIEGIGSTFENNGIINVRQNTGSTIIGIEIANGAAGVNHGAINVGTSNMSTTQPSSVGVQGVSITGAGSSFLNDTDGLIYIGRAARFDTAASTNRMDWGGADTLLTGSPRTVIGILAGGAGLTAQNSGQIIIGASTANAIALGGRSGGIAHNTQTGTITYLNNAPTIAAAPIPGFGGLNEAMTANGRAGGATTPTMINEGEINLLGVNSIGMHALAGGIGVMTDTGVINVDGGYDPVSQLRNYGVVAEGADSFGRVSQVQVSGTVNLGGDYAIGLYANQGGQIQATTGSQVVFDANNTGAGNQIGFYAYKPGSVVAFNAESAQEVNAHDSVLYRVEGGADFVSAITPTVENG
ncbi:MAG: ESPR domain-containing protein, partial [Nevskiaceae bacterium]|nr:ESPR domain-containing protein [Nevskiaceae bacterium]